MEGYTIQLAQEENIVLSADAVRRLIAAGSGDGALLYLALLADGGGGARPLVLAGRNAHRSFLSAAALLDFDVEWLRPQPADSRLTCRQYGAMMHQKEQNKQHPVYRLFNTRTNTIRKHHQRGKISDELRREALYLAETYRDRALMDNDYAAGDYAHDMEQEALYAQARARLAQEDKP